MVSDAGHASVTITSHFLQLHHFHLCLYTSPRFTTTSSTPPTMSSSDSEILSLFSRPYPQRGTSSPLRKRGEKIEELLKKLAVPVPEKLTYTHEDLAALGISFSLSSRSNITEEMKFFQPISAADLATYNFDKAWIGDDEEESLHLGPVNVRGHRAEDKRTHSHCLDWMSCVPLSLSMSARGVVRKGTVSQISPSRRQLRLWPYHD